MRNENDRQAEWFLINDYEKEPISLSFLRETKNPICLMLSLGGNAILMS